jgi:hypothetical protein
MPRAAILTNVAAKVRQEGQKQESNDEGKWLVTAEFP